jgi:single-strand DNA-binding protein
MNQVRNSVRLIGNLGKDPESIATKTDTVMTTFSLATNDNYTKNGDRVSETQWHRCKAFGKKAESIMKYAKKGIQMAVDGQIKYSRYTDKAGVERLSVDIIVSDFLLLNNKSEQQA